MQSSTPTWSRRPGARQPGAAPTSASPTSRLQPQPTPTSRSPTSPTPTSPTPTSPPLSRRADLTFANLTSANFTSANLTDARLVRADLGSANLIDARLVRADLGSANLGNALIHGRPHRRETLRLRPLRGRPNRRFPLRSRPHRRRLRRSVCAWGTPKFMQDGSPGVPLKFQPRLRRRIGVAPAPQLRSSRWRVRRARGCAFGRRVRRPRPGVRLYRFRRCRRSATVSCVKPPGGHQLMIGVPEGQRPRVTTQGRKGTRPSTSVRCTARIRARSCMRALLRRYSVQIADPECTLRQQFGETR